MKKIEISAIEKVIDKLRRKLPYLAKNGLSIVSIDLSNTTDEVIFTFDNKHQETIPVFLMRQIIQ